LAALQAQVVCSESKPLRRKRPRKNKKRLYGLNFKIKLRLTFRRKKLDHLIMKQQEKLIKKFRGANENDE
jgi:hypothetical protein